MLIETRIFEQHPTVRKNNKPLKREVLKRLEKKTIATPSRIGLSEAAIAPNNPYVLFWF